MRRLSLVSLFALVAAAQACSEADPTTAPTADRDVASAFAPSHAANPVGPHTRLVVMMDACDPATFDAFAGPGTCLRNGGMTFDQFLTQLGAHQRVGAWRFAPAEVTLDEGEKLLVVNRGGETHTFTEVDQFGGGFIDGLNQLSGNPVPAAECTPPADDDFIPAGGSKTEDVEESGTELYQCCIHPWMRMVVHVKAD